MKIAPEVKSLWFVEYVGGESGVTDIPIPYWYADLSPMGDMTIISMCGATRLVNPPRPLVSVK